MTAWQNCLRERRKLHQSPSAASYSNENALSVFNEGPKPGKRLIPLGGYLVEIPLDTFDRLGIEGEQALAASVDAADNFGALQNAKMFGDSLACEPGTPG